jgi:endogenous inhibitor of DNA gyrase (YacG/DUF329 family)
MTHDKRTIQCPHCGHTETKTALLRTHCAKCGRPLKTNRPFLPEIGLRGRPLASP